MGKGGEVGVVSGRKDSPSLLRRFEGTRKVRGESSLGNGIPGVDTCVFGGGGGIKGIPGG